MPLLRLPAFALALAHVTLPGCAPLAAERIVVVSAVARVTRGRPTAPDESGASRGGAALVVATLTRPPPSRRFPSPVVPDAPPERGRAPLSCLAESLCAYEALAVRDALEGVGR